MTIDANSPVPLYQQIANHVRHVVAAGVYRPGEMIPSVRALALELGVNPNTVQRAYEQLEREGLVHARRGLGMFVSKEGAASAQSQSEAAVYAEFAEGIRVGQDAKLSNSRIRANFQKAWKEAYAQTRSSSK